MESNSYENSRVRSLDLTRRAQPPYCLGAAPLPSTFLIKYLQLSLRRVVGLLQQPLDPPNASTYGTIK
eukprot:1184158-Prorocentrum_minimum.AAC.2